MTRRIARAGVAALALGLGCSSAPPAPHGVPVLLAVYWIANGARFVVWSPPDMPDPELVTSAPAPASEVDFVFNRRLAGDRIEDTVTVNGMPTPQSKANPPVTASWPDAAHVMSDPPFAMQVFYNSSAIYGGTTSYVFARPGEAGFPSGTTVTFNLDRANITSPYNEQLLTPDAVPVTTRDFTVEVKLPVIVGGGAAAVGTGTQVALAFSSQPAAVSRLLPFVHARAGGADLELELVADVRAPTLVYLTPAAQPGATPGWPPGATVEITVDAGLPDAFGVPLAAAASATFTTVGAAPDAGTD
jgi:hypothetical protein